VPPTTEEIVQAEQDEHEALEQAKRDSPFAGLEQDAAQDELPAKADPEAETEDEPADDDETTETPPADPEGKALFDRSQYEKEGLQIPKVDGQSVDRIAVAVTGEIMLDRSDEADVALYNRLALGKEVELRVAGKVQGTGAKGATNRDGDLDVIVGKKTIKVGTVWVLDPEAL
jgi:hypothetical protein